MNNPAAWLYTENRWKDGPHHRLTLFRQSISEEDKAEYEITEDALYTHPLFTPAERQYLLRLLGGSLEGGEGMTALGVLELRGKLEGMGDE